MNHSRMNGDFAKQITENNFKPYFDAFMQSRNQFHSKNSVHEKNERNNNSEKWKMKDNKHTGLQFALKI